MNLRKKIFVILFIIFYSNFLIASEIKIERIVGNEIITNLDVEKQYKLLTSLNKDLVNVEKSKIYNFALSSLIDEKIKLIELKKYFDLEKKENDFLKRSFVNFYNKYNFQNEEDFLNFLSLNNLDIKTIKTKIKIESLWNTLIFDKFSNQVEINYQEIDKQLMTISLNSKINEYNISEILFTAQDQDEFKLKKDKIYNSIKSDGFDNTAILYNENSLNKSGKIGWITENKIGANINKQLKNIDIGNVTNPLRVSNGFLILKLNNTRIVDRELDLDKEKNQLISIEKNKQLNQFSTIYFNKISKNASVKKL